jgi:hypothetical protein
LRAISAKISEAFVLTRSGSSKWFVIRSNAIEADDHGVA